jgi:cardiolipin synthase
MVRWSQVRREPVRRTGSTGLWSRLVVVACALVLAGCHVGSRVSMGSASGSITKQSAAARQAQASRPAGVGASGTRAHADVPEGKLKSHRRSGVVTNSSGTGATQLLTEPQAGIAPWSEAIADARATIDVNAYLLTSNQIIDGLRAAAARGVRVDIILAGNPYHDRSAPRATMQAFAGSRVQLRLAPSRFEHDFSFDHAKYLIIDEGLPDQVAILGSANDTASAFDGHNLEDAIETTAPRTVRALTEVFDADWTGRQVGSGPRAQLVLSPGSGPTIVSLLRQRGPVAVMAEELGDAPSCYQALAAHGSRARLLVPSDPSSEARRYLRQLVRAGVEVRMLAQPYVHAKLIVTASAVLIGSQNLSDVSLNDNREVGLIASSRALHHQVLAWFNAFWVRAVAWRGSTASTPLQGSSAP